MPIITCSLFWSSACDFPCSLLFLATTNLPSILINLLILHISHDSSDALCHPLWSASLVDMMSARPIRVVACVSISLPFTEVCRCIVFIRLLWFIHSWRDGRLGQCHFSAMVNHAAVIIHVQVFMWHELLLLFGVYQGTEEPGYRATLFLTFWGTYQNVSSCTIFQFSR